MKFGFDHLAVVVGYLYSGIYTYYDIHGLAFRVIMYAVVIFRNVLWNRLTLKLQIGRDRTVLSSWLLV